MQWGYSETPRAILINPDARYLKFVNPPVKIFIFKEKLDEAAFESFVLQTIEREGGSFFAKTEVVSEVNTIYSDRVFALLRKYFAMA